MVVYKPDEKKLIKLYEQAMTDITKELAEAFSVSSVSSQVNKVDQTTLLLQVYDRLNQLNDFAEPELQKLIEQKYKQSLTKFMVETGQAGSITQAEATLQFGLHSMAKVDMLATDTFQDLLRATDNVKESVKAVIQEIAADSLQLGYAKNQGQTQLIKELTEKLSKELLTDRIKAEGFTGIIDKSGRKWSLKDYSDMLVKTKMEQVDSEVNRVEGLANDYDLAVISSHGATDDCSKWEGCIISMNGKTDGYITYEEVKATNECFHPRCQHHLQVFRDISLVHDRILKEHNSKIEANRQTIKEMKEAR